MTSIRLGSVVIALATGACSGGGNLTGTGGTPGAGGTSGVGVGSGSAGTFGSECLGAAGCPTDAAPAMCPQIVSQPNYACASTSTSVACAMPRYPKLIRSGQDVYVAVDTSLFKVGPGGLTPVVDLPATWYSRDILVDDGYVYYFDDGLSSRMQLVRRRLDGSDAPAVYWSCAGEKSSLNGNLVADAAAIYVRTALGTFRVEKRATPPASAPLLWSGNAEGGSMAVDDDHLYVSDRYDIHSLGKTSTCACMCDASPGSNDTVRGSGLSCPGDMRGSGGSGGGAGSNPTGTGGGGGAGGTPPVVVICDLAVAGIDIPSPGPYGVQAGFAVDDAAVWFGDYDSLNRINKDGTGLQAIVGPRSANPTIELRSDPEVSGAYVYAVVKSGTQARLARIDRSTRAVSFVGTVGDYSVIGSVRGVAATPDAVYVLAELYPAGVAIPCSSEIFRFSLSGPGDGGVP